MHWSQALRQVSRAAMLGWLFTASAGTFAPLAADDIILVDGTKIGGEVIGETDEEYIIRRGEVTFNIAKVDIAKIVKKTVPAGEYQARFDKIAKDDVKGYWELSEWCKANGLHTKAQELARLVIELQPDHAAARAALGQKLHDGKWMTEEEAKTAAGWKKIDGKWMSPEDYELAMARQKEKEATAKYYQDMEKELVDLGSNDGDKIDAAMQKAVARGEECHPILYKFIETRLKRDDVPLRLGAIKALAAIGKITQYSRGCLCKAAMRDTDERVNREAARAIKSLNDVGAINIFLDQASDDAKPNCYRAAMALKEIDNNEAFQLLVNAIREEVVQSAGAINSGGMSVTVARGVEAGPLKALKWIAGKDLGNTKAAWQLWLDQKTGKVTKSAPVQGNELRKLP